MVIGISGGGSRVEIDLRSFMGTRATLTGSTLRSRSRKEKGEVADRVSQTLIPRWRTGEIARARSRRASPWKRSPQAYDYFAQPGKFGKVVLRVEE